MDSRGRHGRTTQHSVGHTNSSRKKALEGWRRVAAGMASAGFLMFVAWHAARGGRRRVVVQHKPGHCGAFVQREDPASYDSCRSLVSVGQGGQAAGGLGCRRETRPTPVRGAFVQREETAQCAPAASERGRRRASPPPARVGEASDRGGASLWNPSSPRRGTPWVPRTPPCFIVARPRLQARTGVRHPRQ